MGGSFQKSQEESILLIVSVPEDEFWKPRWVQGAPAACLCPCAQGRAWEASWRRGRLDAESSWLGLPAGAGVRWAEVSGAAGPGPRLLSGTL